MNDISYLGDLNSEQEKAVRQTDGPVLVLAGAGTGKTKALTARVAYLIKTLNVRSHNILAVTFTNKAANEMKFRIEEHIGHLSEGLKWIGTFHSICVKILRRHAEKVNLNSSFTIINTDDQIRLLRQVIKLEHIKTVRKKTFNLTGKQKNSTKFINPAYVRLTLLTLVT